MKSTNSTKVSLFVLAIVVGLGQAKAQSAGLKEIKKVKAPRASIEKMKELSPEFAKLTDELLFDDIWNRPGLSPRDKSLITISVLVATGRPDQAESHIKLGLENGLTEKEIEAAMTHIAFYAGWPSAVTGLQRLKAVKDQKGAK
jgi:4-carboxymuconolactone decarboxylase